MNVKMEHDEVVQACTEWVKNHFGLETKGSVTIVQSMLGYVTVECQVTKPDNRVLDDKT